MERKRFIKMAALLPLIPYSGQIERLLNLPGIFQPTEKMPVFFVGHGDPENAFRDNPFTQSLRKMGTALTRKPSAILVISGHYLTAETTWLKVPAHFNCTYYDVDGATRFSTMIPELSPQVKIDESTDLDHGAWAILRHIMPDASIPVMELSVPVSQRLDYHWNLAQQLKPLREKGVLIIGSGNIVHNLQLSLLKGTFSNGKPYSWAIEFDDWVKARINERDFGSLFYYRNLGKLARRAVPTEDHYIPMLYSIALADKHEEIHYTYEEVFSAVSMRCFTVGRT
ncbi:dioxygenase family protein [Chitinophaga ginsengisoli]|uniref:4,5-DOPA dioxygenase extradiol n=1 Tax=Chitinophaga ginsengisoli TaxID=363837 RepID=A0A2P8G6X1_9BACT|nr:class III extradiol ring-cleavage dioxygenase [Chitinophaga ginsengisoli]PSL29733.1 4,5-DOPA dioxygenase extradiol [Chitinophaga ginsengisoli]